MRYLIMKFIIIVLIALSLMLAMNQDVSIWFLVAILIIGLLVKIRLLHDLIQLIKEEDIKKKGKHYIEVLIGELVLFFILAAIFEESYLILTWGLNIIFTTMGVMLYNLSKLFQNSRTEIGCLLYIFILFIVIFVIANNVLFLVGVDVY